MITSCPVCAASMSLDVLVSHDEARDYMQQIFSINERLGRRITLYLGLFRPPKTRKLTFARMATLLAELFPDIQAGQIMRNGNKHDTPVDAWIWGIEQILNVRGTLTLPLKSHGYLYEVLSRYEGLPAITDTAVVTLKPEIQSKTFAGMDELGDLAGWIPEDL